MTIHNRIASAEAMQSATKNLARQDQRMAELIRHFGPVTYEPWQGDLFTALVSSIISQQLSIKAAATILGRVKTLLGDDQVISAHSLYEQEPNSLRAAGLSHAKVRYAHGLAESVVAGELNFSHLCEGSDAEIKATLVSYAGIGDWTAEMFLIFAMGAPDILATGDLGLKRGMQRFLSLEDYPEPDLFIYEAEIWRPYRSLASWYLWRLAE